MRLDLDALDKFAAAAAAAPDDSLSERLFEIELRVAYPQLAARAQGGARGVRGRRESRPGQL